MNTTATTTYNPIVPLVGRILIAAIFLIAGAGKVMKFAGTAAYFTKLGFPAPEVMTVIAIIIELGGAILLIVGSIIGGLLFVASFGPGSVSADKA